MIQYNLLEAEATFAVKYAQIHYRDSYLSKPKQSYKMLHQEHNAITNFICITPGFYEQARNIFMFNAQINSSALQFL